MLKNLFALGVLGLSFVSLPSQAMDFRPGGSAFACRDPQACKAWIMADGEITPDSPKAFAKYLQANPHAPKLVRFNSPGGDLGAGLTLGLILREMGFSTEAMECASACTYAFLGGIERRLAGPESKIGVHRFYRANAALEPDARHYRGQDLDDTQQIMAGLMLYVMDMGVDLHLIALTAEAGPGEMRWLTEAEAIELKAVFEPYKWLPWTLEGDFQNDRLLAVSTTQSGSQSMQIGCSDQGVYLVLTDDEAEPAWFEQCSNFGKYHPVLGLRSPMSSTQIRSWHDSGSVVLFALPEGRLDLTIPPALFADTSVYPMACIDIDNRYKGTTERLRALAQVVLSSCPSPAE
ncbi:MAG: hypothetical protein Q7J46_10175 [Pseudomonas sp.]|nr:hypothetical protein [Pseudomonas sp.]